MKVTVDRFEGEIAVLLVRPDEKYRILFPRVILPGVKEGDLLEIMVQREEDETEQVRKRVSLLIDNLREKER